MLGGRPDYLPDEILCEWCSRVMAFEEGREIPSFVTEKGSVVVVVVCEDCESASILD